MAEAPEATLLFRRSCHSSDIRGAIRLTADASQLRFLSFAEGSWRLGQPLFARIP